MQVRSTTSSRALLVTLSTPFFLGAAPILGKLALIQGVDAFSVAALRTLIAVALLWIIYLVNYRRYIYIYPTGLIGCITIGAINGISSLFYYGGLSYVDASLAQLLNGMYLIFALLLSRLGGQRFEQRTLVRIGLAMVALVLLTGVGSSPVNGFGVSLMLVNALLFAATMILSQSVLYEMPAQTATLYILTTMAGIVTFVWLLIGTFPTREALDGALLPLTALGITTMLSRLAMFTGVKAIGGLQTAIIAVMEIGVSLILAFIILGDRLSPIQAIGVGLLIWCLLLIRPRDIQGLRLNPNVFLSANRHSNPHSNPHPFLLGSGSRLRSDAAHQAQATDVQSTVESTSTTDADDERRFSTQADSPD